MMNKQGDLEALAQSQNYNNIGINKTCLEESCGCCAVMDGYKVFRRERQGRWGGGPLIRTKGKADKADVIMVAYCRPPSQDDDIDQSFYNELRDIYRSAVLLLLGDFNFPDINT